jgi:hypothetical protein
MDVATNDINWINEFDHLEHDEMAKDPTCLLGFIPFGVKQELAQFTDRYTCHYLTRIDGWKFVEKLRNLRGYIGRRDAFRCAVKMGLIRDPLVLKLFNTLRVGGCGNLHTIYRLINLEEWRRNYTVFKIKDNRLAPLTYVVARTIRKFHDDYVPDEVLDITYDFKILFKDDKLYLMLYMRFMREVHQMIARLTGETRDHYHRELLNVLAGDKLDGVLLTVVDIPTISECTCGMWSIIRDIDLVVTRLVMILPGVVRAYDRTQLMEQIWSACPCCIWYLEVIYPMIKEIRLGRFRNGHHIEKCFLEYLEGISYVTPSDMNVVLTDKTTDRAKYLKPMFARMKNDRQTRRNVVKVFEHSMGLELLTERDAADRNRWEDQPDHAE